MTSDPDDCLRERERTILGAFLNDAPATIRATGGPGALRPIDFRAPEHADIFRAISDACSELQRPTRESIEATLRRGLLFADEAIDALRALPREATPEQAAEAVMMLLESRADARRNEGDGSGAAPFSIRRAYTLDDLAADERRELLALADLPFAHGWGEDLDRLLGGGLAPGDVVGLGASSAGAGKTAFLMQIADGIALRSAQVARGGTGPLTPTLLLSEMDPKALDRRTLGRLTGAPASFFRSGAAARGIAPEAEVRRVYAAARDLLAPDGAFSRMSAWQRVARPSARGRTLLGALAQDVEAFRREVQRRIPGREVWPVVVPDPIQRWQDTDASEVEALNELVEEIDALADANGWIVLLTSDTNKTAAAGGDASREPAALFRGSYKLFHSCDAVLTYAAEPLPESIEERARVHERGVTITIAKNRNGPGWGEARFSWEPACGRFRPLDPLRPAKSREPRRAANAPAVAAMPAGLLG